MDTPNRFQKMALEPLSEEFLPIQVPLWAAQRITLCSFCKLRVTFSAQELRRLQFIRWLVRTGRLNEWSE